MLRTGDSLELILELSSLEHVECLTLMLNIRDISGNYAASVVENSNERGLKLQLGSNLWKLSIESIPLRPGKYWLGIGFYDESNRRLLAAWSNAYEITVHGNAIAAVSQCVLNLRSWTHQSP